MDIAQTLINAHASQRLIDPISDSRPKFSLAEAYQVAERIRAMRCERGEKTVGRKIGWTNSSIWQKYGVHAPMWAWMYDHTVFYAEHDMAKMQLQGALQPRIEPEIVFKLKATPTAHADVAELLRCIEWVANGFEIVVSHYPEWKFKAPDTIAAFGMHGALIVGTPCPLKKFTNVEKQLAALKVDLFCDNLTQPYARGAASNVLGNPLNAVLHLMGVLAQYQQAPLQAGEIISTGTMTDAYPIKPGQLWQSRLNAGSPLHDLRLDFV